MKEGKRAFSKNGRRQESLQYEWKKAREPSVRMKEGKRAFNKNGRRQESFQ